MTSASRLQLAMPRLIEQQRQKLAMLAARLEPWNPQAVLARGYAMVSRPDGQLVRLGAGLQHGDALVLQFADTAIDVAVEQRQATLGL